MKPKAKAYPGGKEAKIHNPSGRGVLLTLGQPAKKGNRMAKAKGSKKANTPKKNPGGSKNKKYNPQAARASSKAKKTNPTKKKPSKKYSRKNPFDVAGLNLTELGAAALAAISSQAITSVITDPTSWLGIGIGIGLAALTHQVAPESVKSAATVGAGVVPAVNFINRLTNNAIGNTIRSTLQGVMPAGLLGSGNSAAAQQAAAAVAQQNMAGYPRRGLRTVNGQAVY